MALKVIFLHAAVDVIAFCYLMVNENIGYMTKAVPMTGGISLNKVSFSLGRKRQHLILVIIHHPFNLHLKATFGYSVRHQTKGKALPTLH